MRGFRKNSDELKSILQNWRRKVGAEVTDTADVTFQFGLQDNPDQVQMTLLINRGKEGMKVDSEITNLKSLFHESVKNNPMDMFDNLLMGAQSIVDSINLSSMRLQKFKPQFFELTISR